MKKLIHPNDIVYMALLLLSSKSRLVSGQVIAVDSNTAARSKILTSNIYIYFSSDFDKLFS